MDEDMTGIATETDVERAGFITPVAMEEDPAELFAGDRGVLDPEVRRVLVRVLQRKFLVAERNPAQWKTLIAHQQVIESRLHDLFIRLVVDHERGLAYKKQVRSAELDVPILLKDDPYTRAETLVLIHLRTVFQRERAAGETSARVDVEELEQTVLTYFDAQDHNQLRQQHEIRRAVDRLAKEGLIEEESEGRYRVTPLVEVVMSTEKLAELRDWLRERTGEVATDDGASADEASDGAGPGTPDDGAEPDAETDEPDEDESDDDVSEDEENEDEENER